MNADEDKNPLIGVRVRVAARHLFLDFQFQVRAYLALEIGLALRAPIQFRIPRPAT